MVLRRTGGLRPRQESGTHWREQCLNRVLDGGLSMASEFRPSDIVERTRTWAGVSVVVAGDVAIALAGAFMVFRFGGSDANVTQVVAVLTSAFTAIGTMTTAFFGIRAISNTAQHAVAGAGQQAVAISQQSVARPIVTGIDPPSGAAAGD